MHYLIVVLLGAFLLFQVQPLIAKVILPYFGGGAAVWTACMLFFQAFLLAGYAYSHALAKWFIPKKQLVIHATMLLVSCIVLPLGNMQDLLIFEHQQAPLASILVYLTLAVGLPYFALSTTGPLIQHWYAVNNHGKAPYYLYSWSNVASLLALLTFPFVFEPNFAVSNQLMMWSALYAGYVLLMLYLIYKSYAYVAHHNVYNTSEALSERAQIEADNNAVTMTQSLIWLALSSLGVVFLVATTNAITQNVAPIPFLWVLPLCLYLLTFIISFHSKNCYVRWYWLVLFAFSAVIAIFLHFIGSQFDFITQVILFSAVLFSGCMICHGELASTKPSTKHLTHFYLIIALGGFLGSLFVALVASKVFDQFLEFPLAFVALLVLLSVHYWRAQLGFKYIGSMAGMALVSFAMFYFLQQSYQQNDIYQQRNFYGVLAIKDVEIDGQTERRLIDGTTSHGTQYLEQSQQHIPLSYYRQGTGGALALEFMRQAVDDKAIKAGFVGLGAGALAAYGKPQDEFIFYELNPLVINAAQQYFTYLSQSAAQIDVIEGDARISIRQQLDALRQSPFDVLVLDAFSGDSIPQHLLTIEAMVLYQQILKNQGVIAVHISNSHLNLLPLMQGLANKLGIELVYFHTAGKEGISHDTDWVWLTKNKALVNNARVRLMKTPIHREHIAPVIWTDDHSHLMSLLK
ncbi:spermidine synthase [Thalassotalea sediminis]|uniref:spermidine synthase n=1 Tax=Thalassotalea sediminis TaxID=1759089 RepID=UPI0025729DD0|nr:fused MFS/spermidine synthase [Thalassotalea sediminis]